MTSSKMPSIINAAIFPPSEIFLISKRNNFMSAAVKIPSAMMRRLLNLYFMPSQIITKENNPQMMVRPAFE